MAFVQASVFQSCVLFGLAWFVGLPCCAWTVDPVAAPGNVWPTGLVTTELAVAIGSGQLPKTSSRAQDQERYLAEFLELLPFFLSGIDGPETEADKQVRDKQLRLLRSAFPDPGNDEFQFRCLEAALKKDLKVIERQSALWLKSKPKSIEAAMTRYMLKDYETRASRKSSAVKSDKPLAPTRETLPNEWASLLTLVAQPDAEMGEYTLSLSVQYLFLDEDMRGAIVLLKAFANNPKSSPTTLFSQSDRILGKYRALKSGELRLEAELRELIAVVIESSVRHSRLSPDDCRPDLLHILFREYVALLTTTERQVQGLSWLDKMEGSLDVLKPQSSIDDSIRTVISHFRLILLCKTNRDRAADYALQRLNEGCRQFDEKQSTIAELATVFANALLLCRKDEFPKVVAKMRSYGLLDTQVITRQYIQGPQDTEQDLETNRVAISGMWNAYFSRFVAAGVHNKLVPTLSELLAMQRELVQFADEEPKPVFDDNEGSQFLYQNLKFAHALSVLAASQPERPLLNEVGLEQEHWFDVKSGTHPDWRERVVVLVLTQESELSGNRAESFAQLQQSLKTQFGERVFLALVFDDDMYDDSSHDEWHPPIPSTTLPDKLKTSSSLKIPTVYSYKNKLMDLLIPPVANRPLYSVQKTLVFDQRGKIRRVVFDGQEQFESLQDMIAKLLATELESPKTP